MNARITTILTSTLLFSISPLLVTAQEHRIESHVISGGGGSGSAGDITITGTIGQPAAETVTGGETTLHAGFWGGQLSVVVEPDESFADWMENLPDGEKPPEGERGPEDAPAGDGMPNLLKYALGFMPLAPASQAKPAIVSTDGYLGIELERSPDAAVDFHLEGSSDFEEWVDVPYSEEIIDSDPGGDRERINLLSGLKTDEYPRYFLRLRVVMD